MTAIQELHSERHSTTMHSFGNTQIDDTMIFWGKIQLKSWGIQEESNLGLHTWQYSNILLGTPSHWPNNIVNISGYTRPACCCLTYIFIVLLFYLVLRLQCVSVHTFLVLLNLYGVRCWMSQLSRRLFVNLVGARYLSPALPRSCGTCEGQDILTLRPIFELFGSKISWSYTSHDATQLPLFI